MTAKPSHQENGWFASERDFWALLDLFLSISISPTHPLGLSDGQRRAVSVVGHQKPILTKCSSLKYQYMKQYPNHIHNTQHWDNFARVVRTEKISPLCCKPWTDLQLFALVSFPFSIIKTSRAESHNGKRYLHFSFKESAIQYSRSLPLSCFEPQLYAFIFRSYRNTFLPYCVRNNKKN